ncbi:MAG TPA: response regulator [Gammaproteobacteria bacterium]|nr:response regulator [Gammaproteobacteria bacterium]
MTNDVETLLVVDDDPVVRELLRDYFDQQGYEVRMAASAAAARELLNDAAPQLVFLDVGMPGEDGLSLARHIREQFDIPIVMISGAGEPLDRIVGLEIGADDYVTKPFDPRELLARVKCIMRRYRRVPAALAERASDRVRIPGFELDMASRRVFREDGGEELLLTRMEFDLLQVFVEHPNRVLSRDQLLSMTQNREWDPFDRSIDIRVARLRRKLEERSGSPQLIRTVRGVGYMFAR